MPPCHDEYGQQSSDEEIKPDPARDRLLSSFGLKVKKRGTEERLSTSAVS